MMKKIINIIAVAFACGIVAETAVFAIGLAHGAQVEISTAIELGVCWLVVLATFVAVIVGGHLGSRVAVPPVFVHFTMERTPESDKGEDEAIDEGEDEERT